MCWQIKLALPPQITLLCDSIAALVENPVLHLISAFGVPSLKDGGLSADMFYFVGVLAELQGELLKNLLSGVFICGK